MKRFLFLPLVLLPLASLADGFEASKYRNKPADWFRGDEGGLVVSNVLSHQSAHGSWPKNTDTAAKPSKSAPEKIAGTFDNGATTGEIRFLADAFAATGDGRCRDAALRGIDAILKAQYPNGGWPQYFPPPEKKYNRHITFNDDSMTRLLELLREVTKADRFKFAGDERRTAAKAAFDRGIACILKCQVIQNGVPTVWCAQHDEVTLAPAPARAYELASLSGSESAGLLMLLMSLEDPSPEVKRAVEAGVKWFESAKIAGIRVEKVDGDRKVLPDPAAPPLWARFYELETGRPFFCDRDGIKKYSLAEIGHERRNGYAWYGTWGEKVRARYEVWSAASGKR